jgi:hypothetical protein
MAWVEGSDVRVATLEGEAACMGAFRQATSQPSSMDSDTPATLANNLDVAVDQRLNSI